jgi:uncharacterized protein YndB with AHSA1/START domain
MSRVPFAGPAAPGRRRNPTTRRLLGRLAIWAGIAGLTALGPAGPARAADDGIKVWTEPVAGSDTPWAFAEATIDAPPETVWALVSRCADYARRMPRIAASRELAREGTDTAFTTTCEVTTDLPFPLSDLTSVNRAEHTVVPGERYVRQWRMVRGDYDFNEGSWTLTALDGGKRTKAAYRIRVRPKIALPDAMLASAQKGTLPDLMRSLRTHATKR